MMHVIKANGEKELFSEEKVLDSIRRAGIPKDLRDSVLSHVKEKVYDNIPSAEVYHHITEFLGQSSHPYARAKYSLKQSIMLLGPTGYPFEDFIARILESQGYETKVRQILMGNCVSHEIDVIANKNGTTAMIEAKFHNNPGIRSEVHVSLYTKARFDDIKEKFHLQEAWVVTNTKATSDAIAYAECVGMKVISWSYPESGSLRDLIEKSQLHPITMLTALTQSQKMTLLGQHIVLCKEIKSNQHLLDLLYLADEQKQKVLDEITFVTQTELLNKES